MHVMYAVHWRGPASCMRGFHITALQALMQRPLHRGLVKSSTGEAPTLRYGKYLPLPELRRLAVISLEIQSHRAGQWPFAFSCLFLLKRGGISWGLVSPVWLLFRRHHLCALCLSSVLPCD